MTKRDIGNDTTGDGDVTVTKNTQRVFQENPIIKVFEKPSNLRVLVTLIDAGGRPLSVSEITEQADVSTQSFYNNEGLLLEYDLIEVADKVGNTTRYRVDLSYEPIQALANLYDTMIDIE